jgi:hypothetical protein
LHHPLEREAVLPAEFLAPVRAIVAAVAVVAAIYVYFLIFAQFGFLQALLATGRTENELKPILAVMGASGIGASALVAWGYTEAQGRAWLGGALVVAGIAANLAVKAETTATFFGVAALTGLGVGGATVAVAAQIHRVIGTRRLGFILGTGTGLAYGFCNLPAVFAAAPAAQARIAQVAAVIGLLAVAGLAPRAPAGGAAESDGRGRSLAVWVVVFLALVGLDSAAFYVIQHNPALQGGTWHGPVRLYANAGLHLFAAMFAGWALDRGGLRGVVLAAMGLLAAACLLLHQTQPVTGWAASLYVTGVSLYSTALVFYPARSGRAGVAAWVYAVAGWAGSALGIGLVEHSETVPGWLPVGAGLVMLAALALRRK